MQDWGLNPHHGWDHGPFSSSDGFFPAPPGMAWYELPLGGGSGPPSDDWNYIRGAGYQTYWDGAGPSFGGGQGWHELPLPGQPQQGWHELPVGGSGGGGGPACVPAGVQYLGPLGGAGGADGSFFNAAPPFSYPYASSPPFGGASFGAAPFASSFGAGPYYPSSGQYQTPHDPTLKNDGIPGLNLKNPHGGSGLAPGTNYLFPPSHCTFMVIKSTIPPWQIDPATPNNPAGQLTYKPFSVPTNMTVKEVMQQFGCDNVEAGKNVMTECTRGVGMGGNGWGMGGVQQTKWYRGRSFRGDMEEEMGKKLEEVGWNGERDGVKDDVVWVWFSK